MIVFAALALFSAAPTQATAAPATVSFDISGRNYQMPMPNGYCIPQELPTAVQSDQSRGGTIVANLAYMQNCRADGDGFRFIYLKYLKNFDPKAPSRTAYLASMAKQMGSPDYLAEQESEAFANRIERRMEAAHGKTVGVQIAAIHLGYDDYCVYQARTMETKLAGDAVGTVRMVGCTTWINGRVVSIDFGSSGDKGLGFGAMARELRHVVTSIELAK